MSLMELERNGGNGRITCPYIRGDETTCILAGVQICVIEIRVFTHFEVSLCMYTRDLQLFA